jgi:Wzt C-terminal domain
VTKHYDYNQHVRISKNVGQIVEIELPRLEVAEKPAETLLKLPETLTTHDAAVTDVGKPAAASGPSGARVETPKPTPPVATPAVTKAAAGLASDLIAQPLPAVLATTQVPAGASTKPKADDVRETVKIFRRGPIVIDDVSFTDETGKATTIFRTWDTMKVLVRYHCDGELPKETLGLAIGIERERDLLMMAQFNTINPAGNETDDYEDAPFRVRPGKTGVITATLPALQMLEGEYILSLGVQANTPGVVEFYEYHHRVYRFVIVPAGYPSGAVYYPTVEWGHQPGA